MIVIGEKINSSIPSSKSMIESGDARAIVSLAAAQRDAGAEYIDINAGMFMEKEGETLAFIARTLKDVPGLRLCVDTPSVDAAREALKVLGKGGGHLINSVTLEKERLEGMTRLALEYGCGVIALCMPEPGMADDLEGRIAIARTLVDYLAKAGVARENIFIDPMLRPLGADGTSGTDALETIRRLRALFPECHISIGLSNLSFGLPKRRLINRAFAVAAIAAGLDAAIADPLDRELTGLVAAAEAIVGHDEYCMDYIGKCRGGMIG